MKEVDSHVCPYERYNTAKATIGDAYNKSVDKSQQVTYGIWKTYIRIQVAQTRTTKRLLLKQNTHIVTDIRTLTYSCYRTCIEHSRAKSNFKVLQTDTCVFCVLD